MKKHNKIIFSLFTLLLILSTGFILPKNKAVVFADNMTNFDIKSKSAYLVDYNSGKEIFAYNENEKYPIASMCKIMTLLLSFEEIDGGNLSLDDDVIISKKAKNMGGSQVFLEENKKYKVSDLIKSIVVASANDASVAMAECISGSESEFVNKMNLKAQSLNMNNTCFSNCTGLPKVGQYSCAKDVSIMFKELLNHKLYFNFSKIWTDKIQHDNKKFTEISNTNKLIRFYNGCDAGKTGHTSEAGFCLCASANRNDIRVISVVIGSPDSKTRFNEVSSMFNYCFSNLINNKIVDCNEEINTTISVQGGKVEKLILKPKNDFYYTVSKGEKHSFELVYEGSKNIKAPICIGDKIGDLCIYEKNVFIGKVDAISSMNIESATYIDSIEKVIKNFSIIN